MIMATTTTTTTTTKTARTAATPRHLAVWMWILIWLIAAIIGQCAAQTGVSGNCYDLNMKGNSNYDVVYTHDVAHGSGGPPQSYSSCFDICESRKSATYTYFGYSASTSKVRLYCYCINGDPHNDIQNFVDDEGGHKCDCRLGQDWTISIGSPESCDGVNVIVGDGQANGRANAFLLDRASFVQAATSPTSKAQRTTSTTSPTSATTDAPADSSATSSGDPFSSTAFTSATSSSLTTSSSSSSSLTTTTAMSTSRSQTRQRTATPTNDSPSSTTTSGFSDSSSSSSSSSSSPSSLVIATIVIVVCLIAILAVMMAFLLIKRRRDKDMRDAQAGHTTESYGHQLSSLPSPLLMMQNLVTTNNNDGDKSVADGTAPLVPMRSEPDSVEPSSTYWSGWSSLLPRPAAATTAQEPAVATTMTMTAMPVVPQQLQPSPRAPGASGGGSGLSVPVPYQNYDSQEVGSHGGREVPREVTIESEWSTKMASAVGGGDGVGDDGMLRRGETVASSASSGPYPDFTRMYLTRAPSAEPMNR